MIKSLSSPGSTTVEAGPGKLEGVSQEFETKMHLDPGALLWAAPKY